MLLTAIITSSVFSVALTTKRNSGRGLRKLIADQAARQLSEQLKNYVTGSSVNIMAGLSGPGAGTNKWSMDGAATGVADNGSTESCISDNCADCYALLAGSHTICGTYLPAWFVAAPYNAKIIYFVGAAPESPGGLTVPSVNITVDWTEP